MYLKFHDYKNNPLVTQCIDKYSVRQFVEKRGCGNLLNSLVGVWENVADIDWNIIPNQFALKCNHGCKMNIICDDKSKLDIVQAKNRLTAWMKDPFWNRLAEINYKGISRKIICEKYLDTESGLLPIDYKIYCFDGIPKLVLVCVGRATSLQLSFFDIEWIPLEIGVSPCDTSINKPISLPAMLDASKKLSSGFKFVRIDFYEYKNKPIFGEMTFTPAACVARYYNDFGQKLLGSFISIKK
jgi:hypothetical protein